MGRKQAPRSDPALSPRQHPVLDPSLTGRHLALPSEVALSVSSLEATTHVYL
ncbi:hypothetical protein P7K49_029973, partial [Saguinus oedipus]